MQRLTLYRLCLAAADAYQDSTVLPADILVTLGQDVALVRRCEDRVIIAFRGTDSAEDWRRNFNTTKCANAHAGFASAALKFGDLVEFYKARGPLVLTGHSMGGAMADYLAVMCEVPCVTFGAPRVFSGSAVLPKPPTIRCVASGDPVPHVPLLTQGFRHRTRETLLTKSGVKSRRDIWGFLKALVTGVRIGQSAHNIDRYLSLAAICADFPVHETLKDRDRT